MLLKCGIGEDSWESLGLQGDPASPEYSLVGLKLKLKLQYFGHLMQRTGSFEKTLMLGKIEGGRRGWDDWMASLTQWTWVWASFGSWWWTGRPSMLQSMGLQRVGNDWVTELNWGFGRQIWRKIVWNIKLMCKINELRGHWQSPLEIKRSSIITHQGDGVGTGLLRDLLSLPAFISEEIYFPGHVLLDLWISLCLAQ